MCNNEITFNDALNVYVQKLILLAFLEYLKDFLNSDLYYTSVVESDELNYE